MLNIIHRLKHGMLPALFFLTSASVLAQPLVTVSGYQESGAVGVVEFSGVLYAPEVLWLWQPRPVRMSKMDLGSSKGGMNESRPEGDFYILGGHLSSLTTSRPGLQPSVTLLQVTPSSPCIVARGGQVRYGEITFAIRHLLAWQDRSTEDKGWSVVSGDVTPYAEQQVKRQLWQVSGYDWVSGYSGLKWRHDAFISGTEMLTTQEKEKHQIAGAWGASPGDLRVNFPGAEGPVKRWQGSLTPVEVYF
ncbi:TPA: fimbrial protein [Escherichia coli]|nr:fimbrial protein [Escherichia coli]